MTSAGSNVAVSKPVGSRGKPSVKSPGVINAVRVVWPTLVAEKVSVASRTLIPLMLLGNARPTNPSPSRACPGDQSGPMVGGPFSASIRLL